MFTDKQLKNMIVPLFIEQLLIMFVGIMDTFIISFVGEEAVSGVSLVNSFNTIFIYLFVALASGGAVVISQYYGNGNKTKANAAASQLVMASITFSTILMKICLTFKFKLMNFFFGSVDPGVMDACITYLLFSAYSYPALAIYNVGASVYRSFGDTKTTLILNVIANIINVAGNCIGVFVLKAGVLGVAIPTFLSRVFLGIAITILCFSKKNPIFYEINEGFTRNIPELIKILRIAIPNGFESGLFQVVKVALSSLIATFGTYQIAANGIAQSFWSLAALVSVAMGPVFITVIGQCMGANDIEGASRYFKKLTKISLILSVVWNGLIFVVALFAMKFYNVSADTKTLVIWLVIIHNIFNGVALPLADPLGKGLRACGDVKYTTLVSIFTTIGVRLVFSYLFAVVLDMKAIGIAYAMCLDWIVRGILFVVRYKQGKWKTMKVIG